MSKVRWQRDIAIALLAALCVVLALVIAGRISQVNKIETRRRKAEAFLAKMVLRAESQTKPVEGYYKFWSDQRAWGFTFHAPLDSKVRVVTLLDLGLFQSDDPDKAIGAVQQRGPSTTFADPIQFTVGEWQGDGSRSPSFPSRTDMIKTEWGRVWIADRYPDRLVIKAAIPFREEQLEDDKKDKDGDWRIITATAHHEGFGYVIGSSSIGYYKQFEPAFKNGGLGPLEKYSSPYRSQR